MVSKNTGKKYLFGRLFWIWIHVEKRQEEDKKKTIG